MQTIESKAFEPLSSTVPHRVHWLAPWLSTADPNIFSLVDRVKEFDIHSPIHCLSISKVSQVLKYKAHFKFPTITK